MSKHTPGPWQVAETRHKYDTLIRNRDNDPVASTNFAGYYPKTAAANARLIAAAPELLAALKKVKRILESRAFRAVEDSARIHGVEYKGEGFTQPDMDNAIRKAEGEPAEGEANE